MSAFEPPVFPPPPPPVSSKKHSAAGIASFAIAILGILSMCVSFGINLGIENLLLPDNLLANRSVDVLIYCSGILGLIGTALGIVGVVQRDVRKLFGILGLVLNLLGTCIVAGMLILYFFVI